MKPLLYNFPLLIILWNAISCSKVPLDVKEPNNVKKAYTMLLSPDSPPIYNYVWVSNTQMASAVDSSYIIGATAGFSDSVTKNPKAILGLSINGRSLNPSNLTYTFDYSDTLAYLQEGINFYGNNINIKVTGTTPADTVSKFIYMPKKLLMKAADVPSGNFIISHNMVLQWTPDPLCTWGNIGIRLDYDGALNQLLNGANFSGNDVSISYTVPDNGTYTISAADLQRFQVRSTITITFARGTVNSAVLPVSKMRVFYFATSSVQSTDITLRSE